VKQQFLEENINIFFSAEIEDDDINDFTTAWLFGAVLQDYSGTVMAAALCAKVQLLSKVYNQIPKKKKNVVIIIFKILVIYKKIKYNA
jgi:uncharacterized protein with PQ loop repeat